MIHKLDWILLTEFIFVLVILGKTHKQNAYVRRSMMESENIWGEMCTHYN